MNNHFIPDKHKRIEQSHNNKQPQPIRKPEPYTAYCFSIFNKTSTLWITFREEVNPMEIQTKLSEAFKIDVRAYSGLIQGEEKANILLLEFPEPLPYKYISKTIKGALSYLK